MAVVSTAIKDWNVSMTSDLVPDVVSYSVLARGHNLPVLASRSCGHRLWYRASKLTESKVAAVEADEPVVATRPSLRAV